MATEKVGIYRSYYGPVPRDGSGQALPQSEWPKKRAYSWVVRWFGQDGNRYSKSFKKRKEAEWFAESKQSEVRSGKADPPEGISLKEFIKEHERVMRGQVAPQTLCGQLRALGMLMAQVGEATQLGHITPRQAEAFVAARLQGGAKVATVNKDIRTLKGVFNLAVEPRGYLGPGRNPFAKVRQRKLSPKPIRFVSPDDFRRLIAATPHPWWKAFLSVAYAAGTRVSEAVNLTWADVDFEDSRIRIVSKEGSAELSGWEPKDHECRIMPVPQEVMQLLADIQANAFEGCPYLFVPFSRWQHIAEAQRSSRWKEGRALLNNLNRSLNSLRRRAGLAKLTFHDLRRSCITNWAGTCRSTS